MAAQARTAETRTLLASLREGGYGDAAHAATVTSVLRQPNSLSLRQAISHASWENPNGEPVSLSAKDRYLHELPRAQAKAIVAIQDVLAKGTLGRGLLRRARKGMVEFGFAQLPPNAIASYDHDTRRQWLNSNDPLPTKADDFIGAAALSSAHELAHCQQLGLIGERLRQLPDSVDDLTIRLDHRILANRHLEAAANAIAIQIAHDNKQAGDNRMWRALEQSGGDNHQKLAFEAAVEQDPQAAKDGRARRAAHDGFFDLTDYMAQYDDELIKVTAEAMTRIAEQQFVPEQDMGRRMRVRSLSRWEHPNEEPEMLGDMPDDINHMALPDMPKADDERYQAPTSERRAGQVMYLVGLSEIMRIDELVTPDAIQRVKRVESREDAAELLSAYGPQRHSSIDIARWRRKQPANTAGEAAERTARPAPAA